MRFDFKTNLLCETTILHSGIEQRQISMHLMRVEYVAHPLNIVVDGTLNQCLTVILPILCSKHQL